MELVREAYVAFNARDADRLCELMAPEGELYPYAVEETRSRGYRGHAGLREYIADIEEQFASLEVHVDQLSEAAEEVIYVRGHLRGSTHEGEPVEIPIGYLWTIRDGRLLRTQADPRGR